MAYTRTNYRTKKQLVQDLKDGKTVEVYQPGLGSIPANGTIYLEGPHFPAAHTWYAQGTMKDGKLVRVK